jgi:hypothetical protein
VEGRWRRGIGQAERPVTAKSLVHSIKCRLEETRQDEGSTMGGEGAIAKLFSLSSSLLPRQPFAGLFGRGVAQEEGLAVVDVD